MTNLSKAKSVLAIGVVSALLGAQWVSAQPAHEHDRHPPQHQHKPPHKPEANKHHGQKPPAHKPPQQHKPPQHKPPAHKPPQQHRPPQHRPPEYRPLPRDFREVRNQAYRNRQYIGRGPLPPKGYQVVRGKRLFGNIGQPLTWQQQRYLPYYRGHEWRRLGRDLLLVDSSSGVVIELFENVL